MATSGPTQLPSFFNVDADFRAYAQGIHNALSACGLVQTGDTGQINLATVVKPAAINTSQGYEIWRFADSQQAANPIYIKIEYGSGGVVSTPSIWLTTGTQTNGAGTLAGNGLTRTQFVQGSATVAGNTLPLYCSGAQDASNARITMFASADATTVARFHGFHIERTLDTNGTPTGDGYFVWASSGANLTLLAVPNLGTVPSSVNTAQVLPISRSDAKSVFGGDTAMSPIFCVLGKITALHILGYNNADLGALASVAVNQYGASHTVMPLGLNGSWTPGNVASLALAMPWE